MTGSNQLPLFGTVKPAAPTVSLNAYCPQCGYIVYAEWIKSPSGIFALCTNHGMKMVECEIRSKS